MEIVFPYEDQSTGIFGKIKRPVADVLFWSKKHSLWIPVKMIVDTGADYTLLPSWLADKLGIDFPKDCRSFFTAGVGGNQKSYVVKNGWKVKLGDWENCITLGFISNHAVPPLLGRQNFLDKLKVTFENFQTTFHA